ncbi:MAG: hypothetical protein ACO1OO_12215 [Flavisolibacter sp.]
MKSWIIILFFPFFATAQTVHVNDDEVEYKGNIKLQGMSKEAVWAKAQEALQPIFQISAAEKDADKTELEAEGRLRLETPYRIIREVVYRLKLEAKNEELEYKIDKVYLQETQRGYETKNTPSKDLIEALEEGGAVVKETEKILNETDMRLHEIFARLKTFLKNR